MTHPYRRSRAPVLLEFTCMYSRIFSRGFPYQQFFNSRLALRRWCALCIRLNPVAIIVARVNVVCSMCQSKCINSLKHVLLLKHFLFAPKTHRCEKDLFLFLKKKF